MMNGLAVNQLMDAVNVVEKDQFMEIQGFNHSVKALAR